MDYDQTIYVEETLAYRDLYTQTIYFRYTDCEITICFSLLCFMSRRFINEVLKNLVICTNLPRNEYVATLRNKNNKVNMDRKYFLMSLQTGCQSCLLDVLMIMLLLALS